MGSEVKVLLCTSCHSITECSAVSACGMTSYGARFTHTCRNCASRQEAETTEADLGGGPMSTGYLFCPLCNKSYHDQPI
jgi:hypothetical protein